MPGSFKTYEIHQQNETVESFLKEEGTVFHSYDYLSLVGKNYKCIVVESDGQIVGALPLVETKRHFLTAYHYPPYTYQFGPVIQKDRREAYESILNELLDHLPESGYYDFRRSINDIEKSVYEQKGFQITELRTHWISKDQDFSLSNLKNDKIRDINKLLKGASKGNIRIIENHPSNIKKIYDLWFKTAKRSKFNIHPEKLKKVLGSGLPHYNNVIESNEGKPLSGTFCPYDNNVMYHIIGAHAQMNDPLLSRTNMLSLFKAIQYAQRIELNFDTEGSMIPGVANFYLRMGAEPKKTYRMQKTKSYYYKFIRLLAKLRR